MLSIERFVVKMMTGQPPQGRPLRASPASNPNRASSTPSVDHSLWNEVLLSCLRPPGDPVQGISGASLFDYKLALSDTSVAASLTGYLNMLGSMASADLESLGDDERLALFMNLYNALAVESVLRWMRKHKGAPPSSINDVSNWHTSVWKQKAGRLAGRPVTLDHIEHEVLRKEWSEPRIHACIVCASLSCPNLRGEAFVAARLSAQMDEQVHQWLSNPTKGVACQLAAGPAAADCQSTRVTLSRILLWFRDDFIRGEREGGANNRLSEASNGPGAELAFVRRYNEAVPTDAAIKYFTYNWSLNIST